MCGIAGIFNLNGQAVSERALRAMTDLMAHRGPDGEGFYLDSSAGLGHRRLAIIDLSQAGRQPMVTDDGRFALTYNGEVYNFRDLRRELESLGHHFKSKTDSEVILHAYSEWGAECVNRFNGMFAFAVWDKAARRLFCCRDRFGVKPFYYFQSKDAFIFASEIKSILAYPGFTVKPNSDTIYRYLGKGYGYMDTNDDTFFAGVKQLRPGHYMYVSGEGTDCRRYWSIDPENKDHAISRQEAKERFLSLLTDSIRLRLVSDVPLGIALSGGLDSTSIAVVVSGLVDHGIETFSACFDEKRYDEREYINEILADSKFIPNFVFPKPKQLIEDFEKILWYQDEPFTGASMFAQWEVMAAAKARGVKVLLTGQGGDETLAGYYKYYPYYLADLLKKLRLVSLVKGVACLDGKHGLTRTAALSSMATIAGSRLCPPAVKDRIRGRYSAEAAFLSSAFKAQHRDVGDRYSDDFDSLLDNELIDSITVSPLPALLHIDDRNSMAHSVESRPPFLDYRLVEFLFSLPQEMKISEGYTKYLLRDSLKGRLPEKIRTRRDKMGFVTPAKRWFSNELRDSVREILNSGSFQSRGIFDRDGVDKVFRAHIDGKGDFSFTIWSWLNLELWFRRFIDGR